MRAASIAGLLVFAGAVHAAPSTDVILTEMGFSAAEKRRVLDGEFVTSKIGAVSERDLSFAVAFFVKTSPAEIGDQVLAATPVADDAQVQAYGKLSEPGSLTDFSGLHLTREEALALSRAEPGDGTNYSAGEYALFKAVRGGTTQAVEEQLRRTLLARYESYRSSGLAGIAPYARERGAVSEAAPDLTKAVQSLVPLQKNMPEFYAYLLDYPRAPGPGVERSFIWMKSIIRDKPTFVLAQFLVTRDGEARAIVRREFFVSHGYNAEQSVAGLLPVTGGTVVLHISHAFTDQVAGATGSLKRSIGSRIMADQMKEIFERSRKRVQP